MLREQHGVAQLRIELANLDAAGVEPGNIRQRRKHARGRVSQAAAEDAAVQIGELCDPAALECDHRLRRAVVKNENGLRRNLGTARGEFDERRDIADPDIGRLARGACDGVGRAFRRLDGHVEAELTEIAALQRVVESGRAAICRKIEHHADLRGALC